MISVELDDLVDMMAHPCHYCNFEPGQCSEHKGCEYGIRSFLKERFGSEDEE